MKFTGIHEQQKVNRYKTIEKNKENTKNDAKEKAEKVYVIKSVSLLWGRLQIWSGFLTAIT